MVGPGKLQLHVSFPTARQLAACPAAQRSGQLLHHGRLVGGRLLAGALAVVLAHALRLVGAAAAAGQEAPEQRGRHVVYLRASTGSVCSRVGPTP